MLMFYFIPLKCYLVKKVLLAGFVADYRFNAFRLNLEALPIEQHKIMSRS